jgi:hypothetical protein
MVQFGGVFSSNRGGFGIESLVIPNGARGVTRQPYLNLIGKFAERLRKSLNDTELSPKSNWEFFVTSNDPTDRGFALLALIEHAVKNNGTDMLCQALQSGISNKVWTYRDGDQAYTHDPEDRDGLETEAQFALDILKGGPSTFQRIKLLLLQAKDTLDLGKASLSGKEVTSVRTIINQIQLLNPRFESEVRHGST